MIFLANNLWTTALGWTLLNSFWQALLLLVTTLCLLRVVPSRYAPLRYSIACAAMAIIVLASAYTFYNLSIAEQSPEKPVSLFGMVETTVTQSPQTTTPIVKIFSTIAQSIEANMSLILIIWCIGALLFTLRFLTGWWFIHALQVNSLTINNDWTERLQTLASRLGISKIITLAESTRIQTPMVIGFLKPVVFVPAGLLSGLSADQIETIFIHELAHIKRHDYLVNLIQTIIESIFFFNPFVWMLSNIIRREREYCCDDTVVSNSGSVKAYAFALAKLEEVRLSKSIFALSLAENKNQLLQRIKRLMEQSAKNYSGRDRLVPAVFLVVGLICASWLTIQSDQRPTKNRTAINSDTTIKKKDGTWEYSKKTVTRYDENGQAHDEVVEYYSQDEDGLDFPGAPIFFDEPVLADLIFEMPEAPTFPTFPDFPGFPGFRDLATTDPLDLDTFPRGMLRPGTEKDWDLFQKEFQERFKSQFSDFYKSNEKELDKMMKELESEFSRNRELMVDVRELTEVDHARAMAAHDDMMRVEVDVVRAYEEAIRVDAIRPMAPLAPAPSIHGEKELRAMEEQMHAMEMDVKHNERAAEAFQQKLKEHLVEDGYLGKDENITSMHWDDEGDIVVNGKIIKEKDRKKYNELNRHHFRTGHHSNVE